MIGHKPDAHYLDRMLGQVKPIIQSVSFVVTDDSPFDFWETIFDKHGIPFYLSRCEFESREQFDFSEARNKALNRCTSRLDDWFLWLDCDDTIEYPERILEQMEAHPGADAYGLPYDVSANQSNLFKIRIHKRGEWRWQNKVHEELVPTGNDKPNLTVLSSCPVKHSPDEGKSNHEFHLSLLKDACKNAPNEYCYIAKESFNLGRWDEALEWFRKVLSIHPMEIEIFNAHLHVGLCHYKLNRPDEAMKSLHRAAQHRPWRREPYFFLATIQGELGADWNQNALANAACCNAQSDHKEPGQNSVIYDCAGYKMHAKLLQAMGHLNSAHAVAMRAKIIDDELQAIILEIEEGLKDKAIAERDT